MQIYTKQMLAIKQIFTKIRYKLQLPKYVQIFYGRYYHNLHVADFVTQIIFCVCVLTMF